MITVARIITEVRMQLQDVIINAYRWTDAELIIYCDNGQKDIFSKHPESGILNTTQEVSAKYSLSTLTSTTSVIEINDSYTDELVNYVVARASEKDINRPDYYQKRYEKNIK